MIDRLIENIQKEINLTMEETEQLFDKIFKGEIDTDSLVDLLDALDKKGETPEELAGATTSMRKNAKLIDVNHDQIVDCCGTGGLGKKIINISTSVSFVLAAAGLKVAKHGNRTATGKSGSADFLEAAFLASACLALPTISADLTCFSKRPPFSKRDLTASVG